MDDFRQMTGSGQLTSDDTITLARAAAEAIRGLNHATRHEAGPGQPSAAHDVIGALALAASRIGQVLAQITRWLDRALAAGRLGHDHGHDPARAVEPRSSRASQASAWRPSESIPCASTRTRRPAASNTLTSTWALVASVMSSSDRARAGFGEGAESASREPLVVVGTESGTVPRSSIHTDRPWVNA